MCVNPKFGYPCGKCHECLARKVNGYIQKYYLESIARKSMHFVTLTYDNEHLPFKVWDFAKGEHNFLYSLSNSELRNVRSDYLSCSCSSEHCPIPVSIDGDPYLAVPSLQRHDVVKWIKSFRKVFKKDFSYSFIGEYGKRGRPHYHGAIFGLSNEEVDEFCRRWTNGFSHVLNVPLVSPAGKSDVLSVSRYIAKYMHKGSFDDPKVLDGLVELPRVVSSLNLGKVEFDKMRDWYLAKDLFPGVSIYDRFFSDDYLDIVEDRLKIFDIGGKQQHLSKSFKDKILKYAYTNKLTKHTYSKASNLSLALNDRVQLRLKDSFEKKYSSLLESVKDRQDLSEADVASKIARFTDSEQSSRKAVEENSKDLHRRALAKSKI